MTVCPDSYPESRRRCAVTGEELLTLRGHETTVWCVAFSPDGKTIASTSNDATLLWETGLPGRAHESRRNVETARKIVDDRFAKLISSREVIDSLRAATAIDASVREVALRVAEARGDNAHKLSQDSWSVVNAAGKDPAA
jgi:WD40 repeat protein